MSALWIPYRPPTPPPPVPDIEAITKAMRPAMEQCPADANAETRLLAILRYAIKHNYRDWTLREARASFPDACRLISDLVFGPDAVVYEELT